MRQARTILTIATLLGASWVILGAWGAHGLASVVGDLPDKLATWDTAVLYQFVHTLSLLLIGLWCLTHTSRWLLAAFYLQLLGVIFFSGSLYLLVLGGPGWLGPVTPLGGTLMIGGWLCAAVAAWGVSMETTCRD